MKRFMLNEKYRKFRIRIFMVLSILVGITLGVIMDMKNVHHPDASMSAGIIFGVSGIWALYHMLRWILSALPNDDKE